MRYNDLLVENYSIGERIRTSRLLTVQSVKLKLRLVSRPHVFLLCPRHSLFLSNISGVLADFVSAAMRKGEQCFVAHKAVCVYSH